MIRVMHLTGVVLDLRVVFPPIAAQQHGFLGLELYSEMKDMPDPDHGFIITSSTGNLRHNDQRQLLGDRIACIVPRGEIDVRRRLEYRPPPGEQPETVARP